ncbi:protein containing YjeF-related protein [gut metagenome]|uniref:Protein containing YjeF-related protein n=1 Tax=gut metagenome TaxID=749906 RepID=J9GEN6_9ZZZZ
MESKMKVVTAKEMKELDKLASEEYGVAGLLLMDQASKIVAEAVLEILPEDNQKAVVFCGKGNNGGDGFGAARWLETFGVKTKVYLLGAAKDELVGDAAAELQMLQKAGVKVETWQMMTIFF